MKIINTKYKLFSLSTLAVLFFVSSCNKDLDKYDALPSPTYSTAQSVGASLAANPNLNMYYKLVQKAGLELSLSDPTKSFTLFATDNNGMRFFINQILPVLGRPVLPTTATNTAFIDTLTKYIPASLANSIISYNIIGTKQSAGSVTGATQIPVATLLNPNKFYSTDLPLSAGTPFLRLPIHVANNAPAFSFANNIPIIAADQVTGNGIIHVLFTVATPPQATLKTLIAGEPTLSYLRAAITRADVNSAGAAKIDSILNIPLLNLTLLAPNDNAMRAVLDSNFYGSVYPVVYDTIYARAIRLGGATPTQATAIATAQAPSATRAQCTSLASNPSNFNLLPVSVVQGILAYHIFASTNTTGSSFAPDVRYFSVNLPSTASFIKTLVNGSFAPHPGVRVQATFAGPSVTAATFGGVGSLPSGGVASSNPPFGGPVANFVAGDKNGVNGVFHIIDRVLLPQ
jgi:hypothetical protein